MKVLKSNKSVFIVGAGFIGEPLALALAEEGHQVFVSKRQKTSLEDFEKLGIKTYYFEVGETLDFVFPEVDVLVLTYPLGRAATRATIDHHAEWLGQHFKTTKLTQVLHCSSTSVYLDGQGSVTENSEQSIDLNSNQWFMENALRSVFESKLSIFRLAGLIGEQRQPGRFLANKENLPNPDSSVNLVHQRDVVRFLNKAVELEVKNEIFNLCYPKHPTRKQFYSFQAQKLGLVAPTFSDIQQANPKVVVSEKSVNFFGLQYENPID